ncbi:hypothetical protein CAter282_0504 [Collimonas arenae]|uniref:Uncharacterized protein n=1 Tax=Collimonas arenae TaxID=279058 RepID=A0A127QE61_9BURK|nr:hypothetical protein CAter10_0539 [Collimonas arenae]AMP08320.1 hypothetical protein CAter282_0504 [Collimonas arenae]
MQRQPAAVWLTSGGILPQCKARGPLYFVATPKKAHVDDAKTA